MSNDDDGPIHHCDLNNKPWFHSLLPPSVPPQPLRIAQGIDKRLPDRTFGRTVGCNSPRQTSENPHLPKPQGLPFFGR